MEHMPAEFIKKLNEEIDIAPILLLDKTNCLDNHALDIIINNEDMNTVLKILKTKLIMIYKTKITASDYDLTILLSKLQAEELNIIHDVVLYALLIQKSSNILKQLLDESCKNLSNVNEKDRRTVNFNLELLDVILEICTLTGNDLIKLDPAYISRLLMKLLCNQEKQIQMKIVKDLIPKYIDCTKDYNILHIVWSNLKDNSFFYDYVLFVLEQYFISTSENEFDILNETEFWITLQSNLTSENPSVKKQSTYLLKRSVQIILQNERYIKKCTANLASVCGIIQWDKNVTHEYRNAWRNFFILCDASNEKQLHLIEPTFKLYNSLALLHHSWRKCITMLFISHPHSAVVRKTVSQILTQKWICDLDTLLRGLNNNYLYDSTQDSSIYNDLVVYISNFDRREFLNFTELLAKQQPSPIPFYYICKSLENYNKSEFDIELIIDLISSSEKVPHLYLRKAIHHSLFLLLTKMQLTDYNLQNEIFFKDFIKVIFLFVNIGYLKRQHCSWKKMLGYLKTDICTKQFENIFNDMWLGNLKFSPKEYAVCFVIMADLGYEIQYDCSNILKYIQTSNNCSTKLPFMLILCHVIKIYYNGKRPEDFNFLHLENVSKVLIELLTICKHLKNQCCLEFANNIEFIIEVIYSNENIREQTCDLLIDFWNKLREAGLYDWYIILSKKIIHIYDQTILIQTRDTSYFMNIIENIKQAKENYLSNDNNVKRQILSNYYYTNMCLTGKLLLEGDVKSILNEFIEYYDKAGTEILLAVLNALLEIIENKKNRLRSDTFTDEYRTLLCRCKTDIFNLRTNEIFRPAFAKLVKIITHPRFSMSMSHELRDSVIDEVFDPSQTVTGLRNEILQHAVCDKELTIKIEILGEALLYGPILRKDQRIEFDTCAAISKEKYMQELDKDLVNPCELDAKVRSQAVVILLDVLRHSSNSDRIYQGIWHILNEKYAEYTGKRYFGDSQIHFLKLRIMQTLHLIINHLGTDYMHLSTTWLLDCLVNESEQPSVKILIQWALLRINSRCTNPESFIADKLRPVLQESKGTTSCTSLFPLMYHIVKDGSVDINIVQDCINSLLPYTMGQHFNIRYYAQMTIKRIYEIYETNEDFKKIYSPIYNTVCNVINQTSSDRSFDMILTYTDLPFTLETLYYDIPRLTNVTHTEWLPAEYFNSLTNTRLVKNTDNFLKQLHANTKKTTTLRSEYIDGSTNVQKKIDPFTAGNTSEVATSKANLIVVASLIDRAPNLGGLSRTCEVFGVRQYVLNNVQFVKNKEYQSLSMSSEKWVDTIEVKVENLTVYLRDMKRKGYKIIGAEQTADSQSLDNFQFEKNTVLLLGNEKEGISPNLIHLLDQCIEIPQFGQIRSLNVHVAGALFIWEYAKQHCPNN